MNNSQYFICEACKYKTIRKNDYEKHLLTAKHKNTINNNKKSQNKEFICKCGKVYKHKASLFNHEKKCKNKGIIIKDEITEDSILKLIKENKEIKDILYEQNKTILEQQKTINDLVPKIGNNNTINSNNTNNIILLLNEKYKDALNLNEFIDSLTISLEDLNITKDQGIVEGITNAFVKNLRELEIHKRPLHCTDIKKDILYIKDNENWEKDKENGKIKKSLNKIAHQQCKSIDNWLISNPIDISNNEEEYIKLVKNSTIDINSDKNSNKIIKNICKESINNNLIKNN